MSRKYLFIAIIFCLILNIGVAKANTLYSLDIDVKLDNEGNGKITEVWDMNVNKGTEVYKPMTNLGNSDITNFKVVDEKGNIYTFLNNWNTSGTLETKKYKNGFNHISGGLELCWGMSSYGKHTYTISYDVSNMIYNTNDAQVLYWKLVNDSMNPAPQKISITISGPNYYSDTLDVWGYGYKGYAYVKDGKIYMSNSEDRNFKSSEYAVILVKYLPETFRTDNKIDKYKTFDDFSNAAQKGSYSHDYGSSSYNNNNSLSMIFSVISSFITFFIFFIFIAIIVSNANSKGNKKYQKQNIDKKNTPNFRDIPCNKDLFKAYFISYIYGFSNRKEDLMGAILLKWLKEKKIQIVKQEKKKFFGGIKEICAIDLTMVTSDYFNNSHERDLYDMMYQASKDGILEENELRSWCSSHYSKFFRWFDKVENQIRNNYIATSDIEEKIEGKIFKNTSFIVKDSIHEEALKLYGLKKYLVEFSRIKEKEPIEVNLWEEYLIFAQIFGIAKEVSKQFKKLYPELIENNESYFTYDSFYWINNIASSGISSASSARSAAQSYSSGGGGFSSGGGGGGSFGGGSGGGCR